MSSYTHSEIPHYQQPEASSAMTFAQAIVGTLSGLALVGIAAWIINFA